MNSKVSNIFQQPKCIERYNNNTYCPYLPKKCCPCISFNIHYCNCKCHRKNKLAQFRNSSQLSRHNTSYIPSQCIKNPYYQQSDLNQNATFFEKKT